MGYAIEIQPRRFAAAAGAARPVVYLSPPDQPDGDVPGNGPDPADPAQQEDLPYRVELWDADKATVELVLAVTASGSIGFAAYHAATREFPDRFIVLRHNDAVLARWNAPTH